MVLSLKSLCFFVKFMKMHYIFAPYACLITLKEACPILSKFVEKLAAPAIALISHRLSSNINGLKQSHLRRVQQSARRPLLHLLRQRNLPLY